MSDKKIFDKVTPSDLWDQDTKNFEKSTIDAISSHQKAKRNKTKILGGGLLLAAAILISVFTTTQNNKVESEVYQFVYESTMDAGEYDYLDTELVELSDIDL